MTLSDAPHERNRPLRLSDLPPRIADALTREAAPGEIDALRARIAARSHPVDTNESTSATPVPAHLNHPLLTPAERQQEIDDRGRYQTLDEQIDDWLDEYGGTIPPKALAELVGNHKAHLASRMQPS